MKKSSLTLRSPILVLSRKWSKRARRIACGLPQGQTVFDFYRWFVLNGGKHRVNGFGNVDNVGIKTYEEVRHIIVRNGFADPDEKAFRAGYCGICLPKDLLRWIVSSWKDWSKNQRRSYLARLAEHYCDGH